PWMRSSRAARLAPIASNAEFFVRLAQVVSQTRYRQPQGRQRRQTARGGEPADQAVEDEQEAELVGEAVAAEPTRGELALEGPEALGPAAGACQGRQVPAAEGCS